MGAITIDKTGSASEEFIVDRLRGWILGRDNFTYLYLTNVRQLRCRKAVNVQRLMD